MLDRIRKAYSKVTRAAVFICGISIAVMMSYGFVDVWARYLFNRPLYGTYELSELLMVAVVFLSVAICQAEDRHMRVDFLFPYISRRVKRVLDCFAYICGITVCGFLAWYSVVPALYSWRIREHSEGIISFPVYPAKFVIVVGASLLGIQLLLDLASGIREFRRGSEAP